MMMMKEEEENVYNTFVKVPHIICKKWDGDSYYLYLPNDHVLVFLNSQFLLRYYWNALTVMESEYFLEEISLYPFQYYPICVLAFKMLSFSLVYQTSWLSYFMTLTIKTKEYCHVNEVAWAACASLLRTEENSTLFPGPPEMSSLMKSQDHSRSMICIKQRVSIYYKPYFYSPMCNYPKSFKLYKSLLILPLASNCNTCMYICVKSEVYTRKIHINRQRLQK
jgi:hypothetical protein